MMYIFRSKHNSSDIKSFLIKKLFNATNQKKVVTRAARESADVQRKIVENYKKLIKK